MKQVISNSWIFLVDCQWSNWAQYSSCSKSCGGGTKTRQRQKTVQESNGGTCNGSNESTESCNVQKCPLPPIDCQWSEWSSYSQCSKSCEGGSKQRIRYKETHESNGGNCYGSHKSTEPCNTQKCPGKFFVVFVSKCSEEKTNFWG